MASERKKSSSKGPSLSGKRVTARLTARKPSKGSATPPAPLHHFAVCVKNDDYPASLELRKLYRVLEDEFAEQHQMVRVIDESGEDYLYPDGYFVRVELPAAVERALAKIA